MLDSSGLQTLLALVAHNAKVYLSARSEAKANAAITEIRGKHPLANVVALIMDMLDLKSVRAAAAKFSG